MEFFPICFDSANLLFVQLKVNGIKVLTDDEPDAYATDVVLHCIMGQLLYNEAMHRRYHLFKQMKT